MLGLFLGLFSGLACAPGGGGVTPEGERALHELERLAFAPKAQSRYLSIGDCSLGRSIVMDLYEFTRGDLQYYLEGESRSADDLGWDSRFAGYDPERLEWPAFLSYGEAEEMARRRGMRLPTPAEWLHVAMGRSWLRYPWGSAAGRFANTLDLGLGRPTRVGTFENGKVRPFGCYDMMGNVWEWVSGEVPSSRFPKRQRDPLLLSQELEGQVTPDAYASVMGGGFDAQFGWLYAMVYYGSVRELGFFAKTLEKSTLSPSVGARMCADAEDYLWENARLWSHGSQARERVFAVGQRWAEDELAVEALVGMLGRLRARPGAAASLGWLADGVKGAS